MAVLGGSEGRESACDVGDPGSIPESGRSPDLLSLEKEMVTYSSILAWRIPTDRGACKATVHGVDTSQT